MLHIKKVYKGLAIRKIILDFRFHGARHYIYRVSHENLSPMMIRVLHTISKRLNIAFINDIISTEYIGNDCYLHVRKALFSCSKYSGTYARLDNYIARDEQAKDRYFTEILRKKCEIDLFLINSNTLTS